MKGEVHLIPGHPVMPVCTGDDCPVCAASKVARDFPFPLAEPTPEPVMISQPCGCTSMVIDSQPVQVSWCLAHTADCPWESHE